MLAQQKQVRVGFYVFGLDPGVSGGPQEVPQGHPWAFRGPPGFLGGLRDLTQTSAKT